MQNNLKRCLSFIMVVAMLAAMIVVPASAETADITAQKTANSTDYSITITPQGVVTITRSQAGGALYGVLYGLGAGFSIESTTSQLSSATTAQSETNGSILQLAFNIADLLNSLATDTSVSYTGISDLVADESNGISKYGVIVWDAADAVNTKFEAQFVYDPIVGGLVVPPKIPTAAKLKTAPELKYKSGQGLDLSALVLEVTYGDAGTEEVKFEDLESLGVTYAINSTVVADGDEMLVKTHNGHALDITVPVDSDATGTISEDDEPVTVNTSALKVDQKELSSIKVKTAPTNTTYIKNAAGATTAPDLKGLVLTLNWDNGKTEDVAYGEANKALFSATTIDITSTGKKSTTITYTPSGDTETKAAPKTAPQELTVSEGATNTITVDDAQTVTYGDSGKKVLDFAATAGKDSATYASSDVNVATMDTSGNLTIKKAGTTTITITIPAGTYGDTYYAKGEASYTLTVDRADLASAIGDLSFSKVYDGDTDADKSNTQATTVAGVGDEALTLTTVTGTYNSKDVADADKVTVSAITLADKDGALVANYKIGDKNLITDQAATDLSIEATGAITKKAITVTGAASKAYDGTTTLVLADITDANKQYATNVNSEKVTLTGLTGAAYSSKNVHSSTAAANAGTPAWSGDDNYTITWNLNGAINKKNITFTGTTTITATKDVETNIKEKAAFGFNDLVSGETLVEGTDYAVTYGNLGGTSIDGVSVPASGSHTFTATAVGSGATMDATATLENTGKANNYNINAGSPLSLTINVSDGKEVAVSGEPQPIVVIGTTGNQDSITDQMVTAATAGLTVTEVGPGTTLTGTWSKPASVTLNPGSNDVTFTWTCGENGYQTATKTVEVFLKKQLAATDFEVSAATCDKTYDATATLPAGAQLVVKDGSKAASQALTIDINGQYIVSDSDTTADVAASQSKYLLVTGVTTDMSANAYYVLPAIDGNFIVGGAKINKAPVTFTLGNNEQTKGSASPVTVTPSIASSGANDVVHDGEHGSGAIIVKYEIPGAPIVVNCGCGAGNALAHSTDCALVAANCAGADECVGGHSDTNANCPLTPGVTICDCGANAAVAKDVVHGAGCPCLNKSYNHDTAKCNCGAGNAAATHSDLCSYSSTPTKVWKEWDTDVENAIKAANVGDTFRVVVYVDGDNGTNFAGTTDPTLGTVDEGDETGKITIKSSGGNYSGGGGSSSSGYTVTYRVTSDGKLASGAKSTEKVKKGEKPAGVPAVIADKGLIFLGWSQDGKTVIDPATVEITKNVTFTALYEKGVVVNYKAGAHGKLAQDALDYETVKVGGHPTNTPEIVAEEGWYLLGWSLDGETVVSIKDLEVEEEITLTALYTDETLSFDKSLSAPYINGIVDEATGEVYFKPDSTMTRGEMAAIVARTLVSKMDEGKTYDVSMYTDVAADAWYAGYIGYLTELGILTGYPDGTFKPDAPIARSEFVAMVIRVDGVVNGEKHFADVAEDYWAAEFINSAAAKGYVDGTGTGAFEPDRSITRAEAVKVMNGVLGWTFSAEGEMLFVDVPETHWAREEIIKASTGK